MNETMYINHIRCKLKHFTHMYMVLYMYLHEYIYIYVNFLQLCADGHCHLQNLKSP